MAKEKTKITKKMKKTDYKAAKAKERLKKQKMRRKKISDEIFIK